MPLSLRNEARRGQLPRGRSETNIFNTFQASDEELCTANALASAFVRPFPGIRTRLDAQGRIRLHRRRRWPQRPGLCVRARTRRTARAGARAPSRGRRLRGHRGALAGLSRIDRGLRRELAVAGGRAAHGACRPRLSGARAAIPSPFTPLEDGRYLLLGPDEESNAREIAKFSQHDAVAWPRLNAFLSRVAGAWSRCSTHTALVLPLPGEWRHFGHATRRELMGGIGYARTIGHLGADLAEAVELTGAARPILDRWFESGAAARRRWRPTRSSARSVALAPGTAYVLLHHVMGERAGPAACGATCEGGMGGIDAGDRARAQRAGAPIRTQARGGRHPVRRGPRVQGVTLAGGEQIDAGARRIERRRPRHVPRAVARRICRPSCRAAYGDIDYPSASM